MPQKVGSLDAWLGPGSGNIGGAAHGCLSQCSQRSRALFGGASRTASAGAEFGADIAAILLQHDSCQSEVPERGGDISLRYHVVSTTAFNGRPLVQGSKRQSLLSLQLRSSSVEGLQGVDRVIADGTVESLPASNQAPACESPVSSNSAAITASGASTASSSPSEAPVSPSGSARAAASSMKALALAVPSSSLSVAVQLDSAESDAAMFASSVACSSSGGGYSSGSNVLHYRDESAGEPALDSAAAAVATASIDLAPALFFKAGVTPFAPSSSSSLPDGSQKGPRFDVVSLSNALSSPPRAVNSFACYSSLESALAGGRRRSGSSFHRLASGTSAAEAVAAALAALPGVSEQPSFFHVGLDLNAAAIKSDALGEEEQGTAMPFGAGEFGLARRSPKSVSYASLFSVHQVLPADGDLRIYGRASLDSRIAPATEEPHVALECLREGPHPRVHGGKCYLQHSTSLGGSRRAQVAGAEAAAAARAAAMAETSGIAGLLSGEVSPALYEGTVRHGFPRKAALTRAVSQPITEDMMGSWELTTI